MSVYQEKNYLLYPKTENKREQAVEPDMARMWELSEREFKITRIKMPRALMGELDNMQEQMVDVQKHGNSKKEPKRNASDQNCCKKKKSFDGLISTLDTAEDRNSGLEAVSTEFSKIKKRTKTDIRQNI